MWKELTEPFLRWVLNRYRELAPDLAPDQHSVPLAYVLLRHYFGDEWAEQVFRPGVTPKGAAVQARKFFDTACAGYRRQERIVRLAELVYNLQSLEGIRDRLVELANSDAESSYNELEFASFFYRRGFRVRFNPPSSTRTPDLRLAAGSFDCDCEIKCKCEETAFSQNSLKNSLSKARKQLPAGAPGMIGIKVPQEWIKSLSAAKAIIGHFLRTTSRVALVVVRVEEQLNNSPTGCAFIYRFYDFPNVDYPQVTQLLAQRSEKWLSLINYCLPEIAPRQRFFP